MKSLIQFLCVVGLSVPSRSAPSLLMETSQTITPEDVSYAIQIVGDNEGIYLSILADDLGAYGLLLGSRTLAAFQVSQEVGACALAAQRSATAALTDAVNAGRNSLMSNYSAIREMLTKAKTEQEIVQAMEYFSKMNVVTSQYFTQVTQTLATEASAGIAQIQKCTSPGNHTVVEIVP